MAFKDISVVLYDGAIKLDYKDKAHRYYVRDRVDFDLPESDPKAWSKIKYPKGTTTLLGDVLEKKALMTWPMGLALRELFGFYDFKNENGEQMTGFSKDVGTIWGATITQEELLPVVLSASIAWQRKQKKGADIGSVVHDAIEHHVRANPNKLVPDFDKDGEPIPDTEHLPDLVNSEFDIAEAYNWLIKESEFESEAAEEKAWEEAPHDVACAEAAFAEFKKWWAENRPELVAAEELVYSRKHNVSGTFDAIIKLNGKTILVDWKTSNASMNKDAAMPEGISYQYFIQDGIYALAWEEMHTKDGAIAVDDIIDEVGVVSCRKDGGFSVIFGGDLGFEVNEVKTVAEGVINIYEFIKKCKDGLWERRPKEEK